MPHFDACALVSDDERGLDFLRAVLDVPADRPAPSWNPSASKPIPAAIVAVRLTKVARRRKVLVSEAA